MPPFSPEPVLAFPHPHPQFPLPLRRGRNASLRKDLELCLSTEASTEVGSRARHYRSTLSASFFFIRESQTMVQALRRHGPSLQTPGVPASLGAFARAVPIKSAPGAWGWSDGTVGKTFALHTAHPGSILGIPQEVIPGHRLAQAPPLPARTQS